MIPPNEFNEYFNIMEVYGIKPEAFLMIIKYCTDLKGEDIGYKYISAVAKDFGARKILTPEQVEKELSAYHTAHERTRKAVKGAFPPPQAGNRRSELLQQMDEGTRLRAGKRAVRG